ncbi:hypothetical protein KUTeg_007492 [Tegillarca granosa]|uniref:Uncharacterized protein n=1 Tax=Tegillarca granosa TaxID=220873 RepID=A0ABQ9FHF7_TEGGR|nr:hypothetical protein KUTeg_007492 [Tegillarca granosa]
MNVMGIEVWIFIFSEKTEGSTFSRSRSSSISNSMENVSKEAIQSLVFADSYARKTDNYVCPCLWVDCNGVLIPTMSEQWKDLMKEKEKDKEREKLQSSKNNKNYQDNPDRTKSVKDESDRT